MWRLRCPFLLVSVAAIASMAAAVAHAAQLPGGAGSFIETHGDWTVACRGQNGLVGCVASQVQANPQTGKPMLSAEVRPAGKAGLDGALLLPFGMALAQGAQVTGEGFAAPLTFAFSTCLPGGCIVPMRFEAPQVSMLRQAARLQVRTVQLSNGEEVVMTISLNGFSAALDRAAELAK